ncbi:MAG: hypothetical protein ACK4UN_11150, partial [Limisphaerales bacterium]
VLCFRGAGTKRFAPSHKSGNWNASVVIPFPFGRWVGFGRGLPETPNDFCGARIAGVYARSPQRINPNPGAIRERVVLQIRTFLRVILVKAVEAQLLRPTPECQVFSGSP